MSEVRRESEVSSMGSPREKESNNPLGLECRRCGHVRHLHVSHSRGAFESFFAEMIGLRAYRCHACQWRGQFPSGVSRAVKRHLRHRKGRRFLVAVGVVLFLLLLIEIIIFVPEIGDRLVPPTPFGDP